MTNKTAEKLATTTISLNFENLGIKALDGVDKQFDRVISIGDIHGCLDSLAFLIDNLAPTEKDLCVFVGDYVDRGPDSPGVIEYLLDLDSKQSCVFLRGNHDSMMLSYFRIAGEYGDVWTDPRNGGDTTLKQYKVSSIESKYAARNTNPNYTLERIAKSKIPSAHMDFLKNTLMYFEMDHAFYSHAGFNTYYWGEYDEQNEESYTWTREQFIGRNHIKHLDKQVVHGHTINRPEYTPYYLPEYKQINLDSGCFLEGNLSALIVYPTKEINDSMFAVSNVEDKNFIIETIQNPRYAK